MVSFCGRLTSSVSTNNVQMNTDRSTSRQYAASRNSAAGNFALGISRLAMSLAPPGSHGTCLPIALTPATVTPIINALHEYNIFFVSRTVRI